MTPWSVATYAGLPVTTSFGEEDPGRVETTLVHGFEFVLGTTGQPKIGAPTRSPSHSTAPPWTIIRPGRGGIVTVPPCMQRMTAFVASTRGIPVDATRPVKASDGPHLHMLGARP